MDWYLWVLIGFVIYNFLFLFIYIWKTKDVDNFTIIATILFLIIPFLWIYIFIKFIELSDKDKDNHEETFTIHNLTKENKITLRQMGFQEGKFVSSHNLDYSGFRWWNASARIIVLYNGRVLVQGRQDENTKTIVSIIRNLPKPIVKEEKESEVNE
jgi:hypothetical protein